VGGFSLLDSEGNSSVQSSGFGNDGARCGGVMASPAEQRLFLRLGPWT
jgi:hypothetical protein